MKLTGKIGWISLNNVSKKLYEFDSNVFRHFKDYFFKVLVTDVVADGLPLVFNRDEEPCFPFYQQSNPTGFKSFDEDLLTLVERFDKAILEQLLALSDARAILSLFSTDDLIAAIYGNVPYLVLFCV